MEHFNFLNEIWRLAAWKIINIAIAALFYGGVIGFSLAVFFESRSAGAQARPPWKDSARALSWFGAGGFATAAALVAIHLY